MRPFLPFATPLNLPASPDVAERNGSRTQWRCHSRSTVTPGSVGAPHGAKFWAGSPFVRRLRLAPRSRAGTPPRIAGNRRLPPGVDRDRIEAGLHRRGRSPGMPRGPPSAKVTSPLRSSSATSTSAPHWPKSEAASTAWRKLPSTSSTGPPARCPCSWDHRLNRCSAPSTCTSPGALERCRACGGSALAETRDSTANGRYMR